MVHRIEVRGPGGPASLAMTLTFQERQKSRFKTLLDDGSEVEVVLPRGPALKQGDTLVTTRGDVVSVVAKPESLSVVNSDEALALCRAAYHLGNRHVPVQIERGRLAYQHDHVLDEMVRGLGLSVSFEQAPFDPETGAYGAGHSHLGGHHHNPSGAQIHLHEAPPSVETGDK